MCCMNVLETIVTIYTLHKKIIHKVLPCIHNEMNVTCRCKSPGIRNAIKVSKAASKVSAAGSEVPGSTSKTASLRTPTLPAAQ